MPNQPDVVKPSARPRDSSVRSLPLTDEAESPSRTLAERALDNLRGLILTGVLAPGERLRLEELATTLRLSPMPVREAVRRLEQLGLVQHIPHRGARVTPNTVEEFVDLYEARLAVEPLAVRKAAGLFTEEAYQAGLALLQRLHSAEAEANTLAMWKAHAEFHFLIYRTGRSAWLLRTIEPMWERAQCYRIGYESLMIQGRQEEHLRILAACRRRDAEQASNLMHNHLAVMGNRMTKLLGGKLEDPFPLKDIV